MWCGYDLCFIWHTNRTNTSYSARPSISICPKTCSWRPRHGWSGFLIRTCDSLLFTIQKHNAGGITQNIKGIWITLQKGAHIFSPPNMCNSERQALYKWLSNGVRFTLSLSLKPGLNFSPESFSYPSIASSSRGPLWWSFCCCCSDQSRPLRHPTSWPFRHPTSYPAVDM